MGHGMPFLLLCFAYFLPTTWYARSSYLLYLSGILDGGPRPVRVLGATRVRVTAYDFFGFASPAAGPLVTPPLPPPLPPNNFV